MITYCPPCNATERNSEIDSAIGLTVPLALILLATAAVAVSCIPYQTVVHKARVLSDSGQATFFTPGFYRSVQVRLRLIATADLVLAVVALWFRKTFGWLAAEARKDYSRLGADMKSALISIPVLDGLGLPLLVAIAAWLRFGLLFQPMRDDEASTFLLYASRPFYVGLSFYNFPNNHLLNTFLVRCSYLAWGNSPWVLRLPVFIAGLLLVPVTYIASRSLYKSESGLLAAGSTACASLLIEYSTNARGYILVALVCMLLIPLAAHGLRTHNWASWFLIGILSAAGFFAVPVMLYPFGAIVTWVLLCSWREDFGKVVKGLIFTVVCCGIVTLQLYAPVLAVSGPEALLRNKWVKAIPLHAFAHDLPVSFASTWAQWNWGLPHALVWILAAGFLAALIFQRRLGYQHVALPLAITAWVLALLAVQRVVPFERVWLFAVPVYFVAASAGLDPVFAYLKNYRLATVTIVLGIVLLIGMHGRGSQSVYLSNEGRGLEQLASHLKGNLRQGDSVIAVLSSDAPLRYYFQKYGISSSYINAAAPNRVLLVVNQVAGDTVQSVIDFTKQQDLDAKSAKLVANFDSVELYEIRER